MAEEAVQRAGPFREIPKHDKKLPKSILSELWKTVKCLQQWEIVSPEKFNFKKEELCTFLLAFALVPPLLSRALEEGSAFPMLNPGPSSQTKQSRPNCQRILVVWFDLSGGYPEDSPEVCDFVSPKSESSQAGRMAKYHSWNATDTRKESLGGKAPKRDSLGKQNTGSFHLPQGIGHTCPGQDTCSEESGEDSEMSNLTSHWCSGSMQTESRGQGEGVKHMVKHQKVPVHRDRGRRAWVA